MKESWKPINGFEAYAISDAGRVRRIQPGSKGVGYFLKPCLTYNGYQRVNLVKNRRVFHRWVHRLVLENFVSERPSGYETHHKDFNKTNNHVSNLTWVTKKENGHQNSLHEVMTGSKNPRAKLTETEVNKIREKLYMGISGLSLARKFHVSSGTIDFIKRGVTWKHI